MGHVNLELPARAGEPAGLQPRPVAAHRGQRGNQLFGLTALGPESLQRIAQPAQLHRDALARKILQHIQQADPPFGGRQLQGPVKLGRLNWLRQVVNVTEGSHQQQHLLQQGRSVGIEQYGLQLQGQVGLQHRFELLTNHPVGGPVEFGQIAITSKQGRRAAQFGNPDEEVGLQQGQPQPDGFNRSGRWRGQQRSGAKPHGQSTNQPGRGHRDKPRSNSSWPSSALRHRLDRRRDGLELVGVVAPAFQEGHVVALPCRCSQQDLQPLLDGQGLQAAQQFGAARPHPL